MCISRFVYVHPAPFSGRSRRPEPRPGAEACSQSYKDYLTEVAGLGRAIDVTFQVHPSLAKGTKPEGVTPGLPKQYVASFNGGLQGTG